MKRFKYLLILLVICLGCFANEPSVSNETLNCVSFIVNVAGEAREVRIPLGYRLEILTEALNSPRILTFTPDGDIFIGSKAGRVYRLRPPYRQPEQFANPGGYTHSVAFRDGEILVAYTEGLYSAPYTAGRMPLQRGEQRLLAALPGGGEHTSRTVRVGPDGRVYVSLGISGNCSDQYLGEDYPFQNRRGGVLLLDEGGSKPVWRTFASGLRNPVGFNWHPDTRILYASNNGPDHWGFEQPPEYFSELTPGSFHGMPWFQFDGEVVRRDDCIRTTPPRTAGAVKRPVATFDAVMLPWPLLSCRRAHWNQAWKVMR